MVTEPMLDGRPPGGDTPQDLAEFLDMVARRQIRKPHRFSAMIPLFTGSNALPPFERVLVVPGTTAQEQRSSLAYALSEWLTEPANQVALAATGVQLSLPEIKGVIEILRGERDRQQIDAEHFGQDRKTVDGIRDRAVRGMVQVLVAADPRRFTGGPAGGPPHEAAGDSERGTLDARDDEHVAAYMDALVDYCGALPRWFPPDLRFTEIQQEVLVTPPVGQDGVGGGDGLDAHQTSDSRSRPLPLVTALHRYPKVLLLGGPGSGKSWSTKGRCLSLAEAWKEGDSTILPVLVVAARLEERLAAAGDRAASQLPELLAESLPEELVAEPDVVQLVTALLQAGTAVELLIDGYDEIGDERPQVARHLASIVGLLDRKTSRFLMTTRPSSVPQQRVARLMATLELQPFGEREQRAFVDTWFARRPERGNQVKHWISTRRLDLLSTPLLIALLCTVSSRPEDVPPDSEPELLYRVLTRLASDEERFDEMDATAAVVRLRIKVLEQIAGSYVSADRIVDSVSGSVLEDRHSSAEDWLELKQRTSKPSVLDDLTATGLLQKSQRGQDVEVKFLHSAIRDYLIARSLKRDDAWRDVVGRIWSQPEWEPAVAYVAAIVDDPDEVLLTLERRFDRDPLNTARFVAGRALALARTRLSLERRRRTRDELIILLGSNDAIDRSRSATLLAALQDDETAGMVRGLISPVVPQRVVEAALRSVAGGHSEASLTVVAACAMDPRFTDSERESAIEALAELASREALHALEQIAADVQAASNVRSAAAFVALRRLDVDVAAAALLATTDLESRDARWGLAERVGAQIQSVRSFIGGLSDLESTIPDPYCRALISTAIPVAGQAAETDRSTLASAVPFNPALELLDSVVEVSRAQTTRDPLAALGPRFVLDSVRRPALRWLVAERIHLTRGTEPLAMWAGLMAELALSERVPLVDFLCREAISAPETLAAPLREAITEGKLGAAALEELQHLTAERDVATQTETVADPAAIGHDRVEDAGREHEEVEARATAVSELPAPSGAPALETTLEALLADSTRGGLQHYQTLRDLQRTLPPSGRAVDAAVSLTHAIAAFSATGWIDAQPGLAGALEERLTLSSHFQAFNELAKLRAAWPDRQSEVPYTAESYHSDVLDSRAWAALLEENWVESASMALASIGAGFATGDPPAEFVTRVLFAAGMMSGRGLDTSRQVQQLLPVFQQHGSNAVLLRSWLLASAGTPLKITEMLDNGFSPRSFASEAEYIALRCIAGSVPLGHIDRIRSWSACRTVATFLAAIAKWHAEGPYSERIADTQAALERRASLLANDWPLRATRSPSNQGRPPWQRKLVSIAADLLGRDMPESAAAVFETVLQEFPNNAEFINNHGFSLAPIDRERALGQLDRAADLYPRPFAVNVANRMLLRLHRGDYDMVLEIAERYRDLGVSEPSVGSFWLWDQEDVTTLLDVRNIYAYIADIAERAAHATGRPDVALRWRAWAKELTTDPEPVKEDDA